MFPVLLLVVLPPHLIISERGRYICGWKCVFVVSLSLWKWKKTRWNFSALCWKMPSIQHGVLFDWLPDMFLPSGISLCHLMRTYLVCLCVCVCACVRVCSSPEKNCMYGGHISSASPSRCQRKGSPFFTHDQLGKERNEGEEKICWRACKFFQLEMDDEAPNAVWPHFLKRTF